MCEKVHQIFSEDGTVSGVPDECALGQMCGFDKKEDGRVIARCERFGFNASGPVASEDPVCEDGLKARCPFANAPANTPFEIVIKNNL